jgi:hypothetical protein
MSLARLKFILTLLWLFLFAGGLTAELWKALVGRNTFADVVQFFGLSYEQNLPTWYSSSLLLLCAVCLLLIALDKLRQQAEFRYRWLILSLLFFYISLDETATLHEDLSDFFDLPGIFFYGWVIPAGIFVLVVGLAYLPFVLKLPTHTRRQFILAGSLYVGGALGVELLLGWWADSAGTRNLVYGLIDLAEESMEIAGVSVFLVALVQYRGTLFRDDEQM